MSLYSQYLAERTNQKLIEYGWGFIAYTIAKPECFIEDIYVVPEKRLQGAGSELVSQAAAHGKAEGCSYLTCSLAMGAKNKDEVMKAFIGYGFKLLRTTTEAIYWVKEL